MSDHPATLRTLPSSTTAGSTWTISSKDSISPLRVSWRATITADVLTSRCSTRISIQASRRSRRQLRRCSPASITTPFSDRGRYRETSRTLIKPTCLLKRGSGIDLRGFLDSYTLAKRAIATRRISACAAPALAPPHLRLTMRFMARIIALGIAKTLDPALNVNEPYTSSSSFCNEAILPSRALTAFSDRAAF